MPDERLIQEIENILSEVVALGGARERTSIVPNMLVRDASPTGADDYVIIADNRDNDNILALKVPGVIYADNDLVNVIFPEGGEAIAFQQGSGSASGNLWQVVPGTSTDIYYNKGRVGISTATPDYSLQVGDGAPSVTLPAGENIQFIGPNTASGRLILEGTVQADIILIDGGAAANDKAMQLFTEGGTTKFRSFTDAAGVQSDNILVMDHGNGRVGINTASPGARVHIVDGTSDITFGQVAAGFGGVAFDSTITLPNYALIGDGTDVFMNRPTGGDIYFRENNADQMFLQASTGYLGLGTVAPSRLITAVETAAGSAPLLLIQNGNVATNFKGAFDIEGTAMSAGQKIFFTMGKDSGNYNRMFLQFDFVGNNSTSNFGSLGLTNANDIIVFRGDTRVGLSISSPAAQLHVDQFSTTAAIPVLYLDQADVSEEMIEFNTTIGVGNAIEAVGAKTLTTTHFIKVTLPGGLTRYIPVGTIA